MAEMDAESGGASAVPSSGLDEARGAGTRSLDLARWVQFAFILGAVAVAWVLNAVTVAVWSEFAEPQETIATGGSLAFAAVGAFLLYQRDATREWSMEVASELSKVSWPERHEVWSNTTIVIVTSAIAAVIMFTFDSLWSALTDFIY